MPRHAVKKIVLASQTLQVPAQQSFPPQKEESKKSVIGDALVSGLGSGVGFSLGNALVRSFFTSSAPSPPSPASAAPDDCKDIQKQFVKCTEKYDRETCRDILGYNKCLVD
jgi:hypothetical protein